MVESQSDPVTHVSSAEPSRQELVQDLWPDKSLYAAVVLFLTGFVGVLTWAVTETMPVAYAPRAEQVFAFWPAWAILVFSLLAVAAASVALWQRSTRWSLTGSGFAFLSIGFFGVNALLALVALVFVHRAWKEGEDANPATRVLTADMWPDKLLAASLVMLIGGVVTFVWGFAILFDAVTYQGYVATGVPFGLGAVVAGIVALWASSRLYMQRGAVLGVVATVLLGAAVALWVVGPILALAAFVLILLGAREEEFERPDGRSAAE